MNAKVCTAALLIAVGGCLIGQAQEIKSATLAKSQKATTIQNQKLDKAEVLPVKQYTMALEKDKNAVVIDLRQPKEYEMGHLKGARLMNVLDTKAFEKAVSELDKEKGYYIYCRSGRRSQTAAKIMMKYELKIYDLQGGIEAWMKAGLPIEKGPADQKATKSDCQKKCNQTHKGCPHSKGLAPIQQVKHDKQHNATSCQQHDKPALKSIQKQ